MKAGGLIFFNLFTTNLKFCFSPLFRFFVLSPLDRLSASQRVTDDDDEDVITFPDFDRSPARECSFSQRSAHRLHSSRDSRVPRDQPEITRHSPARVVDKR